VLINRLARTRPDVRPATMPSALCASGDIEPCIGKETRRNREAFDFIVAKGLYTRRGLEAAFGTTINFPIKSIEVKAEWIAVDQLQSWNGVTRADAASLYHIGAAKIGDKTVDVALVALHVISKEVPNWTWATFEHVRNPGRCDAFGCRDGFGALVVDVKANVKPDGGYPDCIHTVALKELFAAAGLGEVWLNYCLKGTQTNYVTNTGEDSLLGNSVAETLHARIAPTKSSCITCHGEAAFDKNGKPAKVRFEVGVPKPAWFIGEGTAAAPQFRQADFVWAVPLCAVPDDGVSACVPPPN
jgi:hypothetical protein